MNNGTYNQPMGMNQPMNNGTYNQPTSNPQQTKPQGSSSKMIIGIVLGLVAALAAGFITYSLLTKNSTGKTDYENPTVDPVGTTNDSKLTYKNFEFKKVDGYTYKTSNNALLIGNSNVIYTVDAVGEDYAKAKAGKEAIADTVASQGLIVQNMQIKTVNGREYISFEATATDKTVIMVVTKATTGVCFTAVIAVPSYTADYTTLEDLTKILDNSSYGSGNDTYAAALPKEYRARDLIEMIEF